MTEEPKQLKTEETSGVTSEAQATRRTLLKGLFCFIGAIGVGSFSYGAWRYLAPGAGASVSVEIPLSDIPLGGANPFQYGGIPGMLFRGEDGSVKAFSLVCTHLACTVIWNPEKRTFLCPCHDGLFDSEGNVLSGPPPSPLERLKVEVKGEKVVIG